MKLLDYKKRIYVYRNLHKKCWSLMQGGKVVGHREELVLTDVEFRVRSGGRDRSLREGKKNVHAFCIGYLLPGDLSIKNSIYNNRLPILYSLKEGFVITEYNRPKIYYAPMVVFRESGRCEA